MSKFDDQQIDSTRRTILGLAGVAAAGSALSVVAQAQSTAPSKATTPQTGVGVSGPLKSAGVLTFGANDVLFVGDIAGAAVHAFALRPTDVTSQHDVEMGNFHNFEGRDL
ncbi:MAG: hypothetical protein ACRYG8_30555, partial [Janthinobacterium lividum]